MCSRTPAQRAFGASVGGERVRLPAGHNDVRDASDLADLLRMGRLPEAWIAPPQVRELREAVRHRAKLVALRSGLKAQVHAVLAKAGVFIAASDLFGVTGRQRSAKVRLRHRLRPNASARCWNSSTSRQPRGTSTPR